MKPQIVTVISNRKTALRDALMAKKYGTDMLELRFDLLFPGISTDNAKSLVELARTIKSGSKLPVICTIRLKSEGGKYSRGENDRLLLFASTFPFVDYIDIELSSKTLKTAVSMARKSHKKIIISYHNFSCTPGISFLQKKVHKAIGFKPDIIKIATLINKPSDYLKLTQVLGNFSTHMLSIIPMSIKKEYSLLRLFTYLLNTALIYFSSGKKVAPGQYNISQFHKLTN